MARLLITASADVAFELAPKITALGHQPVFLPLLEIVPVEYEAPSAPASILITSRYALAAASHYRGTPLYVVGQKLAQHATEQDHQIARTAQTIHQLRPHLADDTLYLRGKDVSHILNLPSVICYQANLLPLPKQLPTHDAVILLSARVAAHLPAIESSIFCLSERIAQALITPNKNVLIAYDPTHESLLETIKCWKSPQETL
mgnify:CR=1 FL=1